MCSRGGLLLAATGACGGGEKTVLTHLNSFAMLVDAIARQDGYLALGRLGRVAFDRDSSGFAAAWQCLRGVLEAILGLRLVWLVKRDDADLVGGGQGLWKKGRGPPIVGTGTVQVRRTLCCVLCWAAAGGAPAGHPIL